MLEVNEIIKSNKGIRKRYYKNYKDTDARDNQEINTPIELVEILIEEYKNIKNIEEVQDLDILDPCVGSGNFINFFNKEKNRITVVDIQDRYIY